MKYVAVVWWCGVGGGGGGEATLRGGGEASERQDTQRSVHKTHIRVHLGTVSSLDFAIQWQVIKFSACMSVYLSVFLPLHLRNPPSLTLHEATRVTTSSGLLHVFLWFSCLSQPPPKALPA